MTSLSLQDQMFLQRAAKNLPKQDIQETPETIDEASFKLNPKKKGMFKGKSLSSIKKSEKRDTGTKKKEDVFAINAKQGKFKKSVKEGEELFDENQPKFAKDGNSLDAAKQGQGKKQLGKEGGTSGTSPGPAADQGHGKKAVTGQLDREETEMSQPEQVDEGKKEKLNKIIKGRKPFANFAKGSNEHRQNITKSLKKVSSMKKAMKEDEAMFDEEGDAKGQGTRSTGRDTLGPVRIKADSSPGPAAEQGHGKKPVRGEIYRDGHEGSAGEVVAQGHGKIPVRGEIRREDIQELLAAIMDDKPGEAYDAFTVAIAPVVVEYTAAYKEHIQSGLLGMEEDISEDEEYVSDDEEETDVDNEEEVTEDESEAA